MLVEQLVEFSALTDSLTSGHQISRVYTSTTAINWSANYAYVNFATEDYLDNLANHPDTFTAELYLNGELVATSSAQSEVWRYYEDDYFDGGLLAKMRIEPFGGNGFQLGTYELRIYDTNHTLIEVTTIIVNE